MKKEKGSWVTLKQKLYYDSMTVWTVAASLEGFVYAMEFHDEIKAIIVCLDGSKYTYWSYMIIDFL